MSQSKQIMLHPSDTSRMFKEVHNKSSNLWYLIHYSMHEISLEEYEYKFAKPKSTFSKNPEWSILGEKLFKRALETLGKLSPDYELRIVRAKPTSLLIPGLGSAHVRENGLTIHSVYGIPYIPGSSIKGIVRRWFADTFLDGTEKNVALDTVEKQAADYLKQIIFGTENAEGLVQFYDVFLYKDLSIVPEILTPHFTSYYSNGQAPTDDMAPIPNTFYALKLKEADIMITLNKSKLASYLEQTHLSENEVQTLVVNWIQCALEQSGIGAKTSSGMGRFADVKDITEELLSPIKQKREEERKKIMMDAMSPSERLVHQIEQLTSSATDVELSKKEIYDKVAETQNVLAAQKLKNYWTEQKQWKTSQKQKNKCAELDRILGEK